MWMLEEVSLLIGAVAGVIVSFAVVAFVGALAEADARKNAEDGLKRARENLREKEFVKHLEESVMIRVDEEKKRWKEDADAKYAQRLAEEKERWEIERGVVAQRVESLPRAPARAMDEISTIEFLVKKDARKR